ANCARIREGMSRAEVEAILGGPPGDYRAVLTEPDGNEPFYAVVRVLDEDERVRQDEALQRMTAEEDLEWRRLNRPGPDRWQGDTGNIYVTFFWPEGAVDWRFSPERTIEQGRLDNLVWRIKRQWRKWFPG